MADLLVPLEHQPVVLPDPTVAQSLVLAIVENDHIFLPFFLLTFCNNLPLFKFLKITAKRCWEIKKHK